MFCERISLIRWQMMSEPAGNDTQTTRDNCTGHRCRWWYQLQSMARAVATAAKQHAPRHVLHARVPIHGPMTQFAFAFKQTQAKQKSVVKSGTNSFMQPRGNKEGSMLVHE